MDMMEEDEGFNEPILPPHSPLVLPEWIYELPIEQREDAVIQLLMSLPTSSIATVYNHLLPILHRDFTTFLPFEVSLSIFRYLDYKSLLSSASVSKAWRKFCVEPMLWKPLFEQREWSINHSKVQQWERCATRMIGCEDPTNSVLGEILFPPSFSTFALPNSFPPQLNWMYLYAQRTLLERNWRKSRYEQFELPGSSGSIDGHTECIYSIQYDENRLVSGSRDRTIRVWDLEKRQCERVLEGHRGSVLCLQFSVEQNLLVSGSSDTSIVVWDFERGAILARLLAHTEPVLHLRFDERMLVSCSKDKTIRIWSVQAPYTCLRILIGHEAAVNAVQFVDDRIVSASGDRTLRLWDATTGECLRVFYEHERGIACLQFDGRFIVSGSSDKTIKIFDTLTGGVLASLAGHKALVRTLQAEGRRIVSGSYDETIRIWEDSDCLGVLRRESSVDGGARVFKVQFDARRIICCSQDNRIVGWDFALADHNGVADASAFF